MIKRIICFSVLSILVLYFLTACSSSGSNTGKTNCSRDGEVCVSLTTANSFKVSDPVFFKISVTSTKEFPDLHLTFHTGAEISMDGSQTWENNISNSSTAPGYAYWNFAIKAGQILTFNRVLHFSSTEGYFNINAEVVNTGRTIDAIDSLYILSSKGDGQVILAGTPLPPYTPNVTSAVYGPGTPAPSLVTNPTK